MADLPTNQAAQTANKIIASIEGAVEPLIEAAIIAQVPTLGIPVVKQITDEIETIIENAITKYIETGTDFLIIDIQTDSESSSLNSARLAYIQALQSGDQNAIAAARLAYDQAQSSVARDDGSATPVTA